MTRKPFFGAILALFLAVPAVAQTAQPFSIQGSLLVTTLGGDAFEGIEIDSSPGNAAGIAPSAHAVLTVSLVDEPGHPTKVALDRVLAFLAAMAEPDVTYRVNGQLTVLPIQEHNRAAMDIRTRYDVKGDDYAGSAYLAGWVRLYRPDGTLVPSPQERAAEERRRAAEERKLVPDDATQDAGARDAQEPLSGAIPVGDVPLAIQDAVVHRVAEASGGGHHVRAQDSLLHRSDPEYRRARLLVERIRLQLHANAAEYVERVVRRYLAGRSDGEAFAQWAVRVDEEELR